LTKELWGGAEFELEELFFAVSECEYTDDVADFLFVDLSD